MQPSSPGFTNLVLAVGILSLAWLLLTKGKGLPSRSSRSDQDDAFPTRASLL
jgi:hypothetical protein